MRYYQFIPTNDLFYFLTHRLEFNGYEEIRDLVYTRANIYKLQAKVKMWCMDEIGSFEYDWDYALAGYKLTMYFKNVEDAMAFKLRWM